MTAAKPLGHAATDASLDAAGWRAALAAVPVVAGEPSAEELAQVDEWERGGRVIVEGAVVSSDVAKLAP